MGHTSMRCVYEDHQVVMVCPVAYSGDHLVPRDVVFLIAGMRPRGTARSVKAAPKASSPVFFREVTRHAMFLDV